MEVIYQVFSKKRSLSFIESGEIWKDISMVEAVKNLVSMDFRLS